jgi:hypothetical protein
MIYGRSGILKPTGLGSRIRSRRNGREHPEREDLVLENNSNRTAKKQTRSAALATLRE